MKCFFVSDIHGRMELYDALFERVLVEKPDALLLGGDLLPGGAFVGLSIDDFFEELSEKIYDVKTSSRTRIFAIMGNDDPRIFEHFFKELDDRKQLEYIHFRTAEAEGLNITGYSYVTPSPFLLKDWEKYDVSRYVDPGCIHPEEGRFSMERPENEGSVTILEDLEQITEFSDPRKTIYLFHSPPYNTSLDLADLEGKHVDHAPLDPHIGSVAIQRFIKEKQPFLTLHGHVHESSSLSGTWKEKNGDTVSLSAAFDGVGLCLVEFDTSEPFNAIRRIIK